MRLMTAGDGRFKVREVKRFSPAEQAGLKKGAVVVGAENALFSASTPTSLTTLQQLMDSCQAKGKGITLFLELAEQSSTADG